MGGAAWWWPCQGRPPPAWTFASPVAKDDDDAIYQPGRDPSPGYPLTAWPLLLQARATHYQPGPPVTPGLAYPLSARPTPARDTHSLIVPRDGDVGAGIEVNGEEKWMDREGGKKGGSTDG